MMHGQKNIKLDILFDCVERWSYCVGRVTDYDFYSFATSYNYRFCFLLIVFCIASFAARQATKY